GGSGGNGRRGGRGSLRQPDASWRARLRGGNPPRPPPRARDRLRPRPGRGRRGGADGRAPGERDARAPRRRRPAGRRPRARVDRGARWTAHRSAGGRQAAALLRRQRSADRVTRRGGAALAALLPLFVAGWAAARVGAVAVTMRPAGAAWRRGALGGLALPAVLAAIVLALRAASPAARPATIRAHAAVALLVGLAAYANARGAAHDATDRWLEQTRLLVQEATARLPTSDLAHLAATI